MIHFTEMWTGYLPRQHGMQIDFCSSTTLVRHLISCSAKPLLFLEIVVSLFMLLLFGLAFVFHIFRCLAFDCLVFPVLGFPFEVVRLHIPNLDPNESASCALRFPFVSVSHILAFDLISQA